MAVSYLLNNVFQGTYATVTLAIAAIPSNLSGTGIHELVVDVGTYTENVTISKTNGSAADYIILRGEFGKYYNTKINGNITITTQFTKVKDIYVNTTTGAHSISCSNSSEFYRVFSSDTTNNTVLM